ncbi:MAG: VOC family protein [Porticoccaceae bacterium]|nr:VOC family protein [Porticoccaceae bacterium]
MIRYKKLGYVALGVRDIQKSIPYYRDTLGLQLNAEENDNAFFSCSDDHHNVVLCNSSEPGLLRVAWELESDDELDRAAAHLKSHGLEVYEIPAEESAAIHQGRTLRFQEPNAGICCEFYSQQHKRGLNYKATVTNIARLGHVVVNFPDWPVAVKFFQEVMNFKASDYVDGFIAFMRCYPNRFHHSFGVGNAKLRGGKAGLHHVNFMVTDMDDIGRALNRMPANDVPVVFGPGRHPPSGSIFYYFLEPDGMTLEYSFGMEEFPEENPRKPRVLEPRPDSVDYWGGSPKEDFASAGEILPAQPQLLGNKL